ncbi:MAG: hypothetical protein ABJZ55_07660 [Fuerstiella sp.]
MQNVNTQKRLAHKRKVQAALQCILNDPAVMPNADCADLVVSVSRIEFGRTVREIFIDVFGRPRAAISQVDEPMHDKYMREARERGEDTYIDLTDMFVFPKLTAVIGAALPKQLQLQYIPMIKRISDIADS